MTTQSTLKIKILYTEQEFLDLKEEWETLEKNVPDLTIFQTWVFQFNTWLIFKEKVFLNLITFYNDKDELVGCIPLGWQKQKVGLLAIKQLGFACLKYCDFQNIIAHNDYQSVVMKNFSNWLFENRSQWDDITLRLVRKDFVLYSGREYLEKKLKSDLQIKVEGIAPFITIQEEWDDFQSTLSGKRAKSVRYEIRNLFRQFEGEYVRHTKGAELEKAVHCFMDLHQKRIRQKFQLGAFATPNVRKGFLNLTKELEKYDYIDIHTIGSAEKTIAAIGTFTHNNTVSYFQGGFDPDYFKLSPGKVILAMRITEAIQNNKAEFDFLVGDESYKFAWSTGQRDILRFSIKTGSWKQGLFRKIEHAKERLLQSERFRSFYFKVTGK